MTGHRPVPVTYARITVLLGGTCFLFRKNTQLLFIEPKGPADLSDRLAAACGFIDQAQRPRDSSGAKVTQAGSWDSNSQARLIQKLSSVSHDSRRRPRKPCRNYTDVVT